MKIHFLGTAAAEATPSPFCKCKVCEYAREHGGKNIRTRSQCLIDDDLLVDLGPDTLYHTIVHNINLTKLKTILITHSHSDHFDPELLSYRQEPFTFDSFEEKLKLFCSNDTKVILDNFTESLSPLDVTTLEAYKTYHADDVTFTPIEASHGEPNMECFVFVITRLGKTILYGNDSGIFNERAMDEIKKYKYDCLILDCTCGIDANSCTVHMNYDENLKFINELEDSGCLNKNCKKVITHFSHNGLVSYDEMSNKVINDGIIVSYDNLMLEI